MIVLDDAVAAVRGGEAAILPTDTVYGLCASAYSEKPARRLYAIKGREQGWPSALLAPDVDMLLELLPELRGRSAAIARALLPDRLTLIFPNPACRFRWITGSRPETIGVRVPVLPEPSRAILEQVGALVATSANRPRAGDPRRLEDVPEEMRAACAVVVDGGELPGVASTVIDFSEREPRVLREGAVSGGAAIERALAAAR